MLFPARITTYFEVHYVSRGLKRVTVVEKAHMSELDAWVCAVLVARAISIDRGSNEPLSLSSARAAAKELSITHVRWNRLSRYDEKRPSVFIFGDLDAKGLFLREDNGGAAF